MEGEREGEGKGEGDALDGDGIAGLGAEIVEQLGGTLFSGRVVAEGVDDPDLA